MLRSSASRSTSAAGRRSPSSARAKAGKSMGGASHRWVDRPSAGGVAPVSGRRHSPSPNWVPRIFRQERRTMVKPDTPAPPADVTVPGQGQLHARIKTSMGDMVAKLFEAEAPRTVANFVALALGKVDWTDPKTNQKT